MRYYVPFPIAYSWDTKRFYKNSLESHQQLIDRSKDQIVWQGRKPEREQKHQVRIEKNPVYTLGVPAPRLLGNQGPDLWLHRLQRQTPIYPCRRFPCCCQPQLDWIKMRLSGGWRCSMENYAVFWRNLHLNNFPEILPQPVSPASAILQW